MVRQRVSEIPRQSRSATGVVLQKLDKGETITEVAFVPWRDDDGEGEGE